MVMGAEDRLIPEVLVSGLFREIWPDAGIIKLPNVGHFAQEDAPETLATMIEEFVSSH